MILALHKPCGVLTRFTADGSSLRTLAEFGIPPGVYPLGRLDADSEGLLLLTDEPGWNKALLLPKHAHTRTYWAQVEGVASPEQCHKIAKGLLLRDGPTRPCQARLLANPPELPPRDPPIRFRKNVPTSWLELELTEGRNRQVRRMTAAVGLPTLRLIRVAMAGLRLGTLEQGCWRTLSEEELAILRRHVQYS
jgi:23S rRNA pseudouridine2457 synthase